jgi:hypothetical protein
MFLSNYYLAFDFLNNGIKWTYVCYKRMIDHIKSQKGTEGLLGRGEGGLVVKYL